MSIGMSVPTDQIAVHATTAESARAILMHDIAIAGRNMQILERFLESHDWIFDYPKVSGPSGGPMALVKLVANSTMMAGEEFCSRLFRDTGVYCVPTGPCYGQGQILKDYVCISVTSCSTAHFEEGLRIMHDWLVEQFRASPYAVEQVMR